MDDACRHGNDLGAFAAAARFGGGGGRARGLVLREPGGFGSMQSYCCLRRLEVLSRRSWRRRFRASATSGGGLGRSITWTAHRRDLRFLPSEPSPRCIAAYQPAARASKEEVGQRLGGRESVPAQDRRVAILPRMPVRSRPKFCSEFNRGQVKGIECGKCPALVRLPFARLSVQRARDPKCLGFGVRGCFECAAARWYRV